MKNLTKVLGIAGITAFSFLPLKSEGQEKYISEDNKQLYANFVEFVKEKGKKDTYNDGKSILYFYSSIIKSYEDSTYMYQVNYSIDKWNDKTFNWDNNAESKRLNISKINHGKEIINTRHSFSDKNADGLTKNEKMDLYSYVNQIPGEEKSIDFKKFFDFTSTEQQKIKQEYTNTIKQILHEAKYKNY